MPNLEIKNLKEIKNRYDLILFDLWGVIIEGESTYKNVINFINVTQNEININFVTNAPRPANIILNKLQAWGVNAREDMIITSGDIARNNIINHKNNIQKDTIKICYLGLDRNVELVANINHSITSDISSANIIMLSLYCESQESDKFDQIIEEVASIEDSLIICANPDITIPKHDSFTYAPGYFGKKLEKLGKRVIYSGKPDKVIFQTAFDRNNVKKDRILMIGDSFETDIAGANNFGIDSGLVLSGNSRLIHGSYESIEDKLNVLYSYGKKIGVMPNFALEI